MTLTCTNQKIIDGVTTSIDLNAIDAQDNVVPSISWATGKVTQDTTSTITTESSLTYDSIVTQKTESKKISEFMVQTGNFTLA